MYEFGILLFIVGLAYLFKKTQSGSLLNYEPPPAQDVYSYEPPPSDYPYFETPVLSNLTNFFSYESPAGSTISLNDLYIVYGNRQGLDPKLLRAIAIVESNEDPNAKNPSDPSYGLMQLLCQDDGAGGCKNKLNVVGWPPAAKEMLFDPDYSLDIASQILSWNIRQYGVNKGIAVYNSWSAHEDPPEGPFSNQGYVDRVLFIWNGLKGSS